jgi:membrane protein YqaA with SNARE-associated domain
VCLEGPALILITVHLIAGLFPVIARSVRHWLFQLGGLGLIPLGLLDNTPIPFPGIMDVATVLLSARQQRLWLYYALMATVGSVIGGFVSYRLARKGGKEALERRFSPRQMEKFCKIFERWGFGAIIIPALLPPPVPMVPFLFAAGALQYPMRKFLVALAVGRLFRYMVMASLAARYGRQIIGYITEHGHPVIVAVVLILITVAVAFFYFWGGSRRTVRTLATRTSSSSGRR